MKKNDGISKLDFRKPDTKAIAKPMSKEQAEMAEKMAKKTLTKLKYRKALKTVVSMEMDKLQNAHPDWQLNKILASILEGLNPDLPPEVLLETIHHISERWVKNEKPEPVAV